MKLFFNCFHCLQWNLCLVTVDWWPSDALLCNIMKINHINVNVGNCAWFVMHPSFCLSFGFTLFLAWNFIFVRILYFVFCNFQSLYFSVKASDYMNMNFRIACYINMHCLRYSAIRIHQTCWTFWRGTTNRKSPKQCDKNRLSLVMRLQTQTAMRWPEGLLEVN